MFYCFCLSSIYREKIKEGKKNAVYSNYMHKNIEYICFMLSHLHFKLINMQIFPLTIDLLKQHIFFRCIKLMLSQFHNFWVHTQKKLSLEQKLFSLLFCKPHQSYLSQKLILPHVAKHSALDFLYIMYTY